MRKFTIIMILLILGSLVVWKGFNYAYAELTLLIKIFILIMPYGYNIVASMEILDPLSYEEKYD